MGTSLSEYEVIGVTYDGVKILKPAVPSTNFTEEQIREVIRRFLLTTKMSRV